MSTASTGRAHRKFRSSGASTHWRSQACIIQASAFYLFIFLASATDFNWHKTQESRKRTFSDVCYEAWMHPSFSFGMLKKVAAWGREKDSPNTENDMTCSRRKRIIFLNRRRLEGQKAETCFPGVLPGHLVPAGFPSVPWAAAERTFSQSTSRRRLQKG